jgi:hypothetical protein
MRKKFFLISPGTTVRARIFVEISEKLFHHKCRIMGLSLRMSARFHVEYILVLASEATLLRHHDRQKRLQLEAEVDSLQNGAASLERKHAWDSIDDVEAPSYPTLHPSYLVVKLSQAVVSG